MPSGHRIFKAYPGIEYNIRAAVIGGSYPYRFSLGSAPPGMTVDARTGEIRWPNPSGTTVSPTLTVTDAAGAQRSAPWTITVTTAGFRFISSGGGSDANDGSLAAPWATLAKVKSSGQPGDIVYFRAGTYRTSGMAVSGGTAWLRVEFTGAAHPVQWLAYPGEKPVIDNDYVPNVNNGRFIRLGGTTTYPVYIDGLELTHSWHIALQFASGSCHYSVFRRLDVHDIAQAIDGANSAGIMTLSNYAAPTWYGVFQDIDFHDNAPGGIKLYSHKKVLWEDCRFRSSVWGPDLKAHVPRFEVRGCHFHGNTGAYAGLYGNMNFGGGGQGETASGEWRFNRFDCVDSPSVWAMDVNQDGMAGRIDIYRNTVKGTVRVRNIEASSPDGPFRFYKNVIVNSAGGTDRITLESVSDPSRVQSADNLTGSPGDNIIDASGNLTAGYSSYLGTHGHQIP